MYACKNCKPKIDYAEFEEPTFSTCHAKQISIVISANGRKYGGYLPLMDVGLTRLKPHFQYR